MIRQCSHRKPNGEHCRAVPVGESDYCLMHSPDHAEEVAEARRLGGLRRRREVMVSGAYDFQGLNTVADIRRLLEVAVMDTLGLDNSIARARTLAYLAMGAIKLLEVGELEQRLAALEAAHGKKELAESVFDAEHQTIKFSDEAEAADEQPET